MNAIDGELLQKFEFQNRVINLKVISSMMRDEILTKSHEFFQKSAVFHFILFFTKS